MSSYYAPRFKVNEIVYADLNPPWVCRVMHHMDCTKERPGPLFECGGYWSIGHWYRCYRLWYAGPFPSNTGASGNVTAISDPKCKAEEFTLGINPQWIDAQRLVAFWCHECVLRKCTRLGKLLETATKEITYAEFIG